MLVIVSVVSLYTRHYNFGFSYTGKVQMLLIGHSRNTHVHHNHTGNGTVTPLPASLIVHFVYYLSTFLLSEGIGLIWNDSQTLFTVHAIPSATCSWVQV